jgi:hypothetical protein
MSSFSVHVRSGRAAPIRDFSSGSPLRHCVSIREEFEHQLPEPARGGVPMVLGVPEQVDVDLRQRDRVGQGLQDA